MRPVLRKAQVAIDIDIPPDIVMDSDPGSYGQVLTNILLNAVIHAFPDGRSGKVRFKRARSASAMSKLSSLTTASA